MFRSFRKFGNTEPAHRRRKTNSRTARNSNESPIDRVMRLQRSLGNQIVQRLINSGQIMAKLMIGRQSDPYEREADQVADRVMQMPEPDVQRQAEPEEEEEVLQGQSVSRGITPLAQRQEVDEDEEVQMQTEPEDEEQIQAQKAEEEEEPIQSKETAGGKRQLKPEFTNRLHSLKGGGKPLPESVRVPFENRFGHDFSGVRTHTGDKASNLAKSINAKAFTKGKDIVFGSGHYSTESSQGKKLMAHELTHVVQQGSSNKPQLLQRKESAADHGKNLKAVSGTALKTAKAETKVSDVEPHWAKTISTAHLGSIRKAVNFLNGAISNFHVGAKKAVDSLKKLDLAKKLITKTKKESYRLSVRGPSEFGAIVHLVKAKTAVSDAIKLLQESKSKGIKGVDKWIGRLQKLLKKLNGVYVNFRKTKKADRSELDNIKGQIGRVRSDLQLDTNSFKNQAEAVKKIKFVLEYFISINDPKYSKVPTLEEAEKIRARLGSIGSEMVTLFGGSLGDYELFRNFERQLSEQIQVRSKMKAALGADPGLKPGEADVKKWFKKLKGQSNIDVIDAYTSFAEGFFIHRVEPNPAVVSAKQTLSSIFALPTTISNSRLIVCSGYAVLGKSLLTLSGARFIKYIIGIRASDSQIKCATTYDDVHAVSQLKRIDPKTNKSSDLYVSNHLIVSNKNDAIGPNAVAWDKATNPIYEGTGNTMAAASKMARNKMAKRRRNIKSITCKP